MGSLFSLLSNRSAGGMRLAERAYMSGKRPNRIPFNCSWHKNNYPSYEVRSETLSKYYLVVFTPEIGMLLASSCPKERRLYEGHWSIWMEGRFGRKGSMVDGVKSVGQHSG